MIKLNLNSLSSLLVRLWVLYHNLSWPTCFLSNEFSWYGSTHLALESACWSLWIVKWSSSTALTYLFIYLSWRICCLLCLSNCIAYCLSSFCFYSFIISVSLSYIFLWRLTSSFWSWLNPLKWYGFTLCGASMLTSVAGFSVMKSWLLV